MKILGKSLFFMVSGFMLAYSTAMSLPGVIGWLETKNGFWTPYFPSAYLILGISLGSSLVAYAAYLYFEKVKE